MRNGRQGVLWLLIVGILCTFGASGCQTQKRDSEPHAHSQPTSAPAGGTQPQDKIVSDDTQRALDTIRRQDKRDATQRRPATPPRRRPVDQPRVGR